MEYLALRLDAPMMSFGGVQVDERGVTDAFPGRSLLAGLIGNALGFDHAEWPELQRLQDRIHHATRRDRGGRIITDFQTADLGQPYMQPGWTTRGVSPKRGGGGARTATTIRYRKYLVDSVFTVVLTLRPADEAPGVDDLEEALLAPRRPLYIGRKTCLPSGRILIGRVKATSLVEALRSVPSLDQGGSGDETFYARWPRDEEADVVGEIRVVPVTDERVWRNQVHAGRRLVNEGTLRFGTEAADDG